MPFIQLHPDPSVHPSERGALVEYIDIVAIAGPGPNVLSVPTRATDPFTTHHKDGDRNWLRDYIPKVSPHCRILSYDYDTLQAFTPGSTTLSIHEAAKEFLIALRHARRVDPRRPIIYIAHGLGGLVVKAALVLAANAARFKTIRDATQAVLFFGTPHVERDPDASLEALIARVTKGLYLQWPAKKSRQERACFTERLDNDHEPRAPHRLYTLMGWRSMRQLKFLKTLDFVEGVNPVSYRMTSDINPSFVSESTTVLNASHRNLCRFRSQDDPNYLRVEDRLLRIIDHIRKSDSERKALNYSKFRLIHKLYTNSNYLQQQSWSSKPTPSTCRWILTHSTFHQWHQASRGSILWLTGAAGTGKSTLARYVSVSLKALEEDKSPSIEQGLPDQSGALLKQRTWVLTYRCEYTRRMTTAETILRGLLHQLVTAQPTLLHHISQDFQGEGDSGPGCAEAFVLGSTLWHIAENAARVIVVIDALDELSSGTQETLLSALCANPKTSCSVVPCPRCPISPIPDAISSSPPWKLFITTRDSSLASPRDAQIDLSAGEAKAGLSEAIKVFVESGIDSLARQRYGSWSQEVLRTKPYFLANAHRGFLWATLGLICLKYGMRDLQRSSKFQIPESVNGLYRLLLQATISKFPTLAHNILKTLKWVLLAQRPLTVDELAGGFSFDCGVSQEGHPFPASCIYYDKGLPFWEPLKELCGTFFEIVDSNVFFAHRSVRDFLLSSWPLTNSIEGSATSFPTELNDSEYGLAHHCISYIVSASSDSVLLDQYGDPSAANDLTRQFPFLSYAAVHWFEHADAATISASNTPLAALIDTLHDPKSPSFRAWFPVYWFSLCKGEWQRKKFPKYPTRLIVLALLGNEGDILQILQHNSALVNEHTPAGEEWTPLLAAAWNGRERVAELLLKFSEGQVEALGIMRAVAYALERGHPSVARKLLVHYWRSMQTRPIRLLKAGVDEDEQAALTLSVVNGHADIVQLLINNGVDPNMNFCPSCHSKTPYVELQLPTSPLGLAAFLGYAKTARILLASGASISAAHALHSAAKSGDEAMIKLLLEYDRSDAVINGKHQQEFGRTPLSYAAASGHAAVVSLFLSEGARPYVHDDLDREPLEWAASSGSVETCQPFLYQPGLPRRRLIRALTAACSSAKPDVVHLLLDNKRYGNALADKDILRTASKHILTDRRSLLCTSEHNNASPFLATHEQQRLATVQVIFRTSSLRHELADICFELLPGVSGRQETDTTRYLLDVLGNINADNALLRRAFDGAARSGNDALIRAYLEKGIPIRSSTWQNIALSGCHQAVRTISVAVAASAQTHVDHPFPKSIFPSLPSQIEMAKPTNSYSEGFVLTVPVQYREAAELLDRVHIRPNQEIYLSQDDEFSWTNKFKSFVEDYTRTPWIWYPLSPRLHPLRSGEVWLKWRCMAGTQHQVKISSSLAEKITALRSFKSELLRCSGQQHKRSSGIPDTTIALASSNLVTWSWLIIRALWHHLIQTRAQTSNPSSRSAHQEWLGPGNTAQPSNHAGKASNARSRGPRRRRQYPAPQQSAPGPRPPSPKGPFVLLKALTPKPIHIDVAKCATDALFFEELKKEYKLAKGWFRDKLSIWRYHHCNFDMYTRIRDNLITSRSKGSPTDNYLPTPPHDLDYKFSSVQQMPPVAQNEFLEMYYCCKTKCCFLSRLLHTCNAPSGLYSNGSSKSVCTDATLELIPKRSTAWDLYENCRGEAWGLTIFEHPSFVGVAAYMILTLLPPLVIFILWLTLWDRSIDLQNASVPAVVVLALWAIIFQWSSHRTSNPGS